MGWQAALLLMTGGLLALLALGLPVAFAFMTINVVGAWIFLGGVNGLEQMVRNAAGSLNNITLAPIPLFILMGEIMLQTKLAERAISAIDRIIHRVPGRLPIVSVASGTMFATLSGSTIANTAVLGRAMVPDMLQRGYHPTLALGPIMATGGIAMLIPPSALAVLLGSVAGISISALLVAGILPALLLACSFVAYIVIRSIHDGDKAPEDMGAEMSLFERWRDFLIYVVPLSGIVIVVVGSLFAGIATPTESAALGAIAAAGAAAFYRSLTWDAIWRAAKNSAINSVMILFIIMASSTFSQILTFSGASSQLVGLVSGLELSEISIVLLMLLMLLLLGCFVDQVSMVMITVPIFIPVANSIGIDLVWLGVIYLLAMEISFLTPPVGLLLFVMKGVAPSSITLRQIYFAAMPFLACELLVLGVVVAYPPLSLWLPSLLN
ncbi:MAG: TRAP transporter large permease [Roseitalea sp.]|jgi:tripartite ATP-independent transporter DctM subunit|nr:TRAP transporter large permease [Roseitalea sp.]MBO6720450.1 TRAP transporter large permease [Roseitalea sp.]MBO6742810.1 TRAP transporter large permease [Roseitalea sp.]